jgi:hypothetical protein
MECDSISSADPVLLCLHKNRYEHYQYTTGRQNKLRTYLIP